MNRLHKSIFPTLAELKHQWLESQFYELRQNSANCYRHCSHFFSAL